MKTEKFFEIFTDLDDDLIENAFPKAQEPEIVHPAERIRLWKPFTAAAALVVLACGVTVAGMKLHNLRLAPADSVSDSNPLSSNAVNSQSETDPNISDDFIKTLNSVIDSATDVEALNSGIKSADEDVLIAAIQVFENPAAFEKNTILSAGGLENGMIVLVDFIDGTHYITSRSEQTRENPAFMFESIIRRADSVEQLAAEIDGYNRGLGDKKLTGISLYRNYDDARNGDVSGETIIENGKLVASDSVWKNGGVVRVTYEHGKSWCCFTIDNHSENVNYSYMEIDEQVYFSARGLVNKSDFAVTGKVTDISFELHDMHTGDLLTEYSEDAWLCTVYDIDVITSYKGDKKKTVKIITYNGLEDYKVDKQLELVGEHHIPVLDKPDDINPGSEYLFLLSQPDYDKSGMLHLINHSQGAFSTDTPTVKERYSQASLNDIVDCLTKTDNHSEDVSVIHNALHVSLSDWQYTTLTDTVMQTVTTECLPDFQLQMELSDQRINEYSENGYVIAIDYDDFNAPTYTYGDSSDKKARGICHITVLIGEDGKPSYITYSYIVGASERQDGGTYALSDSSRQRLLQILGGQSSDDHETSDGQETSSQPGPNAYLDTMPATYESAKEQITFVDVKEISDPDFVGYELDYVMPSKTLISLNYVFKDGKEVSVIDNGSGIGTIEITPERYEEIKRGDMSFWRDLSTDRNTVIYISESNIAYIAALGLDTDISHAVDMIVSLL